MSTTNKAITEPVIVEEEERIFLVGSYKKWDITHAVKVYGFDPAMFDGGGRFSAITPINDPKMLEPGDPGYPGDSKDMLIIGFNYSDDARAYPLKVLASHEIVNDRFDSTAVAVAY
jgi:hypothetical protein